MSASHSRDRYDTVSSKVLPGKTGCRKQTCLPRSPPQCSLGRSWVPWLPLIGFDKVTRTNENKNENILAYRKRTAGEWLLGSVDRVALGSVPLQPATDGESAVRR